jgi:hypothetical protein
MGQQSSAGTQPRHGVDHVLHRLLLLVVALQVEFERQTLKPVFSLGRL